jgi:hypothetical protein
MAVKSVTKKMGDSSTQDENGIVLKENYLVLADAADTPLIAYGAVDPGTSLTVPIYGQTNGVVRVANLAVDRVGDEKSPLFNVAVEWRSNIFGEPPKDNGLWNKRVSSSGIEIIERVNKDESDFPIRTTVGQLYQADLELVMYDEMITVRFDTRETGNLLALSKARGRVNDADVTLNITRYGVTYSQTFPEYTLKLGNATWEVNLGSDGNGLFSVEIPLIYRHQLNTQGSEIGWATQIPNRGTRYFIKVGDQKQGPIDTNRGETVDLDKDGFKLPPDTIQYMLVRRLIKKTDFSAFLKGV